MSEETPLNLKDFGASFKTFIDRMSSQAPAEEPVFLGMLRSHFETDPTLLPIVSETFPTSDQPNVQLAINDFLAQDERSAELVGINAESLFRDVSL